MVPGMTVGCCGLPPWVVVGGLVVVGWWWVEICIVDASILVFVVRLLVCRCLLCGLVGKGGRWMPWYQGPMKDVGGRDRPGGAVNLAVIPGCPNGVTRRESCRVTCA